MILSNICVFKSMELYASWIAWFSVSFSIALFVIIIRCFKPNYNINIWKLFEQEKKNKKERKNENQIKNAPKYCKIISNQFNPKTRCKYFFLDTNELINCGFENYHINQCQKPKKIETKAIYCTLDTKLS